MTPLRQRMREALPLRGLSERTQAMSVRAVRHLADHDHTAPARRTAEDRRDACLAVTHVTHASRRASPIALGGITCFSAHPRMRAWTTLPCGRPPRAHTRPVILRPAAVRTLLAPRPRLRSRVCLTPLSACGLRLQDGPHLQGPARARARRRVHGRCGTGAQDRAVPLPPRPRAVLGQDWPTPRHPVWLVPAPGRRGLGMAPAPAPRPSHRGQDAWRAARNARGLPPRAAVHTLRPRAAPPRLEPGVTLRRMPDAGGHAAPTTTAWPGIPGAGPFEGEVFCNDLHIRRLPTPSPLVGEGWDGGEKPGSVWQGSPPLLHPHPNPPPSRGRGLKAFYRKQL